MAESNKMRILAIASINLNWFLRASFVKYWNVFNRPVTHVRKSHALVWRLCMPVFNCILRSYLWLQQVIQSLIDSFIY